MGDNISNAIRMSESQSSYAQSYTSAITTASGAMADTLSTFPSVPPPALVEAQPRAQQPIRLPPIRIPETPSRYEPRSAPYPLPARLPPWQPSSYSPVTLSSSMPATRTRKSSGAAAPIADILSPAPSTPTRSDSGFSPSYRPRPSLPGLPTERIVTEERSTSLDKSTASYSGRPEDPYETRHAVLPSPIYKETPYPAYEGSTDRASSSTVPRDTHQSMPRRIVTAEPQDTEQERS